MSAVFCHASGIVSLDYCPGHVAAPHKRFKYSKFRQPIVHQSRRDLKSGKAAALDYAMV